MRRRDERGGGREGVRGVRGWGRSPGGGGAEGGGLGGAPGEVLGGGVLGRGLGCRGWGRGTGDGAGMEGALEAAGGVRRKEAIQGQIHFSKPCSCGPCVMEPARPRGRAPATGFVLPLLVFSLFGSNHTGAGSSCTCVCLPH